MHDGFYRYTPSSDDKTPPPSKMNNDQLFAHLEKIVAIQYRVKEANVFYLTPKSFAVVTANSLLLIEGDITEDGVAKSNIEIYKHASLKRISPNHASPQLAIDLYYEEGKITIRSESSRFIGFLPTMTANQ